jgi:hypothetical protein
MKAFPLSTCLKLLYFFNDLRHDCEEVTHNTKVCNLKDWSIGVLVDCHHEVRGITLTRRPEHKVTRLSHPELMKHDDSPDCQCSDESIEPALELKKRGIDSDGNHKERAVQTKPAINSILERSR